MPDDIKNVFLLAFNKSTESNVQSLKEDIENESGRIVIKNMNVVPKAKGPDFGKKLQGMLNWANIVLIVCSDNFASFIDKKDVSKCPDIMKNEKDCVKVIKKFVEDDMKKTPTKIVLVSQTNTDYDLPKVFKGMPVVKKTESNEAFIRVIVAEIEGRYA